MDGLISTILSESDESFNRRLRTANPESRKEMLEIRMGINKRNAFMRTQPTGLVYFETAQQKLERIREWYPRCYRVLETRLPGFVLDPDDMPMSIKRLADQFIGENMLPIDRQLLAFA